MRIQKFEGFTQSIDEKENSLSLYKGKTAFSKWLRKVNSSMEYEFDKLKLDAKSTDNDGGRATIASINMLLPLAGRMITGAGAAIADFFSKDDTKNTKSKMSKSDLSDKKDDILDSWEKDKIGNKQVTQKDAEDFYKSGVLSGKKYFGKNYDPMNPKNDDEKQYSSYLNGAMGRYYSKIRG